MDRNAKFLFRMSSIAAVSSGYLYKKDYNNSFITNALNSSNLLLCPNPAEALAREEDLPRLKKLNTNVYVYGEGF